MSESDLSALGITAFKSFGSIGLTVNVVHYDGSTESMDFIMEQIARKFYGSSADISSRIKRVVMNAGEPNDHYLDSAQRENIKLSKMPDDAFCFATISNRKPVVVSKGSVVAITGKVGKSWCGIQPSEIGVDVIPFYEFSKLSLAKKYDERVYEEEDWTQNANAIFRNISKTADKLISQWTRGDLGVLAVSDSVFEATLLSLLIDEQVVVKDAVSNAIYTDLWYRLYDDIGDGGGMNLARATAEVLFWLNRDRRDVSGLMGVANQRLNGVSQGDKLKMMFESRHLAENGTKWIGQYQKTYKDIEYADYIVAGLEDLEAIAKYIENEVDVDTALSFSGGKTGYLSLAAS